MNGGAEADAVTGAAAAPPPARATLDLEETETIAAARRDRGWRRLVVIGLTALVVLGTAGVLGARQGTVTATGGGFQLTVTYPERTRAGLPANWEIHLVGVDGGALPPRLQIASRAAYFEIFDQNGFSPAPSEEWQDGNALVWVYTPPEGASELVVALDARLEPDIHRGRSGHSALIVDGVEVVAVDYTTGIAP